MGARALHGIRLNVVNLDLARQFYISIGMVEDIGMRRWGAVAGGSVLPDEDPSGNPDAPSVSLRWPADPFMHLNLVGRGPDAQLAGWPRKADQAGSTVLTLLVDDVAAEVERLHADGTEIVVKPTVTQRLQGPTCSAFVRDPDDNLLELIEAAPGAAWDNSRCSVFGADRTWLHVELNTAKYDELSEFYEGFGFAHNSLNDVRPGHQYEAPEVDPFVTAWGQELMSHMDGVQFYRLPDDPSEMHLEVMGWKSGLADPTDTPVWQQRGVMRYCFKAKNIAHALEDMRRKGTKIFMEIEKAPIMWGDSEWFFFGDPEHNILTFEEWFPQGHWGERY